jgi:hypothetical protein
MDEFQKSSCVGVDRISEIRDTLVEDVRRLIDSVRVRLARNINSEMVMLYWRTGTRIRDSVLHDSRGEYGRQVMAVLVKVLTTEYWRGFSESSLSRMVKLAEIYPSFEILASLMQELSWTLLNGPFCSPTNSLLRTTA